jgi:hypothetical protein
LKGDRKKPGASDVPAKASDWVDSADFFEALHKKTGRNVIADYYTRIYPKDLLSARGDSLLGVLNHAADALQSDWQEDGGFLRFRRFNYYSERTMDVSNALLKRWQAAREAHGYLNLDDLSEIATLPNEVLEHSDLSRAVMIKYGLDEWPMASSGMREDLLFHASLTDSQKQQIQTPNGLSIGDLNPQQLARLKEMALQGAPDEAMQELAKGRLFMTMRPPGLYEWSSFDDDDKRNITSLFPVNQTGFRDANREKVEAYVAAQLAGAPPDAIKSQMDEIKGPGASVWTILQVGNHYVMREANGGGTRASSGILGESRNRNTTRSVSTVTD